MFGLLVIQLLVQSIYTTQLVETNRRKAPDSSEWSAAELVVFFIKNEGAPILTPAHWLRMRSSVFPTKPFGLKQHP